MLQSIRDRSQSWIAKIIIGAVVVTMALFGVESLIGLFGQSGDEVAKVNGQPINRQQVEVNVQRAMRANQVPADQERALRREVLEGLISDRLMISYAESGGLAVSGQSAGSADRQSPRVSQCRWSIRPGAIPSAPCQCWVHTAVVPRAAEPRRDAWPYSAGVDRQRLHLAR